MECIVDSFNIHVPGDYVPNRRVSSDESKIQKEISCGDRSTVSDCLLYDINRDPELTLFSLRLSPGARSPVTVALSTFPAQISAAPLP